MSSENIYYVYSYTRSENSKTAEKGSPYYIGKGKGKRAWQSHKRKNGSQLLPKDKDCIHILYENLSEVDAHTIEKQLISEYGLKFEGGILANLTYGGEGNSPGKELRSLFSKQQIGRKKPPRTPEHLEKLSMQARGKPNPKTSEGLKKWYATNPDRTETTKKQAESLKKWYNNNSELSKAKARKTWETRYSNQLEKFKLIILLINSGESTKNIISKANTCKGIVLAFRNKTHKALAYLPELIELYSS